MKEIVVAKESDLENGSMLSVIAGDQHVVLFRDRQGEITALLDRCSHAEVRLSMGTYRPQVGEVECAAHGARFDVKNGRPLCMPAVAPVKTFPIKLINGNIIVILP